ncbi:hypothetical protein MUN84_07690 [Hymenobacter sp. 5516J-16]|uniref:Lipoprotein n=1 Tax=Hymenobacter sublimis TaxID=2933777 RepID=A0ABY4J6G0_9BACT|nr:MULTISPECIES: hypothetical protein [Hymenobacter]UOQ78443.1 hypothetical protein MUN84_07690 [Hymenobacter sp. 5516J-16]UPL48412.1 hypothetical protein MWH26_14590 [Hymenobacter sublimis]
MRLHHISLGLLLTVGLTSSCEKIDFGDESGVTEKTIANVPNGHVDESDWKLDDKWNDKEKDLFKDLPVGIDGTKSRLVTNQQFGFYPNPVKQFSTFGYSFDLASQVSVGTQIRFVIVNRKYKVMQEGNIASRNTPWNPQTGLSGFSVSFTDDKYKKGETYRMYYVLYEPEQLAFLGKGHGDIEIAD